MKKGTLILLLLWNVTTFFGQTIFDKFDNQEEVTSMIVNKKMFEMMSKVKMDASDPQAQQYLNLIKNLDNLKVYTTKNSKVKNELKAATDTYTKIQGLLELMRVNDTNGRETKIVVKSGEKESQIKELLLLIDGGKNEDTVVMLLTGDFNLNEMVLLTDKMKIPGAQDLKKAILNK